MALIWEWKDKIGEATVRQTIHDETEEFTVSIYRGNALAIFVYHYEERGEKYYNLTSFFCDEEHAKRMLGLDKKWPSTYGHNELEDGITEYMEFRLNKSHKATKELAKLLIEADWKNGLNLKIV